MPRPAGATIYDGVKLPHWVPVLLGVDRAAWYAYRAFEALRDETLIACLDPQLYHSVTQQSYSELRSYLPGGNAHVLGLFPWEIEVISSPPFPPNGRVLLGGAGGGRELAGLLARSYEVVAFEPNAVLVRGAVATAASNPFAAVVQASFADLVDAVQHNRGPLALPVHAKPFDAVILGWGSLTHVVRDQDRRDLLRSLRALAPGAPVLLSFFLRRPAGYVPGRSQRARTVLRHLLARTTHQPVPVEGLSYQRNGGFVYCFSKEEIFDLAVSCGYRVDRFDEREFPHAVLVPLP